MILRPPTVLMRLRKPCVFALLRRFGWYVRFMKLLYYRHLKIHESISEARAAIQHPRAKQDRPQPILPPEYAGWENAAKQALIATSCGCSGAEDPLSGGVDQAFRRLGRLAFQAVIHRLWISLWITTLMS